MPRPADLEPALAIHRQGFAKHGYTELLDLSTEDYLARINVHYGSVDDVVQSIQADPALLGYADWFLPVVQHEVSSLADDIRRLEIIATEIAPALGWSASSGRGSRCSGMSELSAPRRPFKLGFLTHVHGDDPPPRLYQGIVELFVAAEELGFDSGWVAQHHFQPRFGRLPSPFVLLGAAAARTRTIRLGTGVVVLGLEDPIRLAEDAAVLDALSGGRLDLGVGTGGANTMAFGDVRA